MERIWKQFGGYALLAILVFVGWCRGWRLGLELAGAGVIVFLLAEIAKKNGFYTGFFDGLPRNQVRYTWRGAAKEDTQPGMRNMRFRAARPFRLLVGIEVKLPFKVRWFHTYGFVESRPTADGAHQVIVRTWLGKNPGQFLYLSTISAEEVKISHSKGAQVLDAHYTHWPHWYQQWPLYLWG